MEIRRLDQWEHGKTRMLYEEVFPEDDTAFVDYYYKWKVQDNAVYVAEDENGIHAMVHLNPFQVFIKEEIRTLHYIVAVATQKEYRHQGLMRRLLQRAECDMQQGGELFTFLMPASEKIYTPFGYRFFSTQRQGILRADKENDKKSGGSMTCRPVRAEEYASLAQFANKVLSAQYDIFVWRDASYYERLCSEQRSQNGAVMVICREDGGGRKVCGQSRETIIGAFCMAADDSTELREIIIAPEYIKEGADALQSYVGSLKNAGQSGCKVFGCPQELLLEEESFRPLMMAKKPGGDVFCSEWDEHKIFINEVV